MISARANSARGTLQCTLTKCPPSFNSSCYIQLLCAQFLSTHVLCLVTLHHQHNVGMIQQWAARFVTINYDRTASITEMLHSLKWDTLEARHNNFHVVLLFKIINKLVDIATIRRTTPTYKQHYTRTFIKLSNLQPPNKN